jgi:hypothetical protein
MTGERQLDGGREDADPDVTALLGGEDEDRSARLSSRASRCMSSVEKLRASVKTPSWFPASAVSVKTSTTR